MSAWMPSTLGSSTQGNKGWKSPSPSQMSFALASTANPVTQISQLNLNHGNIHPQQKRQEKKPKQWRHLWWKPASHQRCAVLNRIVSKKRYGPVSKKTILEEKNNTIQYGPESWKFFFPIFYFNFFQYDLFKCEHFNVNPTLSTFQYEPFKCQHFNVNPSMSTLQYQPFNINPSKWTFQISTLHYLPFNVNPSLSTLHYQHIIVNLLMSTF